VEAFSSLCSFLSARPERIETDGGPQFNCTEFAAFCSEHNIHHHIATPHHPQSVGVVERANADIQKAIDCLCHDRKDPMAWANQCVLEQIQGVLNASFHSSIGMSPTEAYMQRKPRVLQLPSLLAPATSSLDEVVCTPEALARSELVAANQQKAFDKAKRAYDADRTPAPEYRPGQHAMVRNFNRESKLAPQWRVVIVVAPVEGREGNIYTVKDIVTLKETQVHVNDIKPYHDNGKTREDILKEQGIPTAEYEVEAVVQHRFNDADELEMQVKWAGFEGPDSHSWIPYASNKANEHIQQYMRLHQQELTKAGKRRQKTTGSKKQ
jgi:hypothetical protein